MIRERVCAFCGNHWRGGLGVNRPALGIDVKFCARACRNAWEANMSFSQMEIQAIEKMLPAMGAHVAEKGLGDKAFNDFSRDEILGLFATTVRTFRTELHQIIDEEGLPF